MVKGVRVDIRSKPTIAELEPEHIDSTEKKYDPPKSEIYAKTGESDESSLPFFLKWYFGPVWAINAANFGFRAVQDYQIYCQDGSHLGGLVFLGASAISAILLGLACGNDGIQKIQNWYRLHVKEKSMKGMSTDCFNVEGGEVEKESHKTTIEHKESVMDYWGREAPEYHEPIVKREWTVGIDIIRLLYEPWASWLRADYTQKYHYGPNHSRMQDIIGTTYKAGPEELDFYEKLPGGEIPWHSQKFGGYEVGYWSEGDLKSLSIEKNWLFDGVEEVLKDKESPLRKRVLSEFVDYLNKNNMPYILESLSWEEILDQLRGRIDKHYFEFQSRGEYVHSMCDEKGSVLKPDFDFALGVIGDLDRLEYKYDEEIERVKKALPALKRELEKRILGKPKGPWEFGDGAISYRESTAVEIVPPTRYEGQIPFWQIWQVRMREIGKAEGYSYSCFLYEFLPKDGVKVLFDEAFGGVNTAKLERECYKRAEKLEKMY